MSTVPLDATTPRADIGAEPGELHILPLSEVAPEAIRWLWPRYLPLGKLAVLEGFPGLGKSAVTLDLAARLSIGAAMPDGSGAGDPSDTLVLSYEDSAADTLRPRVEAAGGNPARVHHIVGVGSHDQTGVGPASLPDDLAALERALAKRPDVRLLVIDPLVSALASNVDANRDQDVRRVLTRLATIAADYGVSILAVRHLRKVRGGPAITAGSGSIGIIGIARGSLLVAQDPDAEDSSVLASVKMNLGATPPSLGFKKCSATIAAGATEISTMRLEWTGPREMNADELVNTESAHDGRGNREADRWLEAALTGGPVERGELFIAARGHGIGHRRVQRAAARLRVLQTREGNGDHHRSFWELPPDSSAVDSTRSTNSTRSTYAMVERVDLVERVKEHASAGDTTVAA